MTHLTGRASVMVAFSLLAVATTTDAQQSFQPDLSRRVAPPLSIAAPSNPYSRLFEPSRLPIATQPTGAGDAKRVVKCGLTMIEGDAGIDPKMAVPRPPDGVTYTIRGVVPPICK